jgi:hypothetical protein
MADAWVLVHDFSEYTPGISVVAAPIRDEAKAITRYPLRLFLD